MSTETALTAFTGIAALALVLQGIALWGIRNSLRAASSHLELMGANLQKKIQTVAEDLSELLAILTPLAQNIQSIQQRVASTSEIVHHRVVALDGFLQESTDTARLQIATIQDLIETVSRRIEETFEILQKGVLTPVTEVNALIRGLKVGFQIFLRGRGRPSHTSHQDEEMFI